MTADDARMRRRAEREIQEDIERWSAFFSEHPRLARLVGVAVLGYFVAFAAVVLLVVL